MKAERYRTSVHFCPEIAGQPTIPIAATQEVALAVEVLRTLMDEAIAYACSDGVFLAVCLDHALFERIAAMGESLIDCEPDTDFEPETEEEH